MTEAEILRAIRIEAGSRPDMIIYRNQVGVAEYTGGAKVPYGLCRGAADLIGIRTVTITPEMVGTQLGQFVALEIKSERGRLSPEQRMFLDLIHRRGGLAATVRSVEELRALLP